eukprot:jgi/Botrbrau1/8409/Bobra.0237s0030.1
MPSGAGKKTLVPVPAGVNVITKPFAGVVITQYCPTYSTKNGCVHTHMRGEGLFVRKLHMP